MKTWKTVRAVRDLETEAKPQPDSQNQNRNIYFLFSLFFVCRTDLSAIFTPNWKHFPSPSKTHLKFLKKTFWHWMYRKSYFYLGFLNFSGNRPADVWGKTFELFHLTWPWTRGRKRKKEKDCCCISDLWLFARYFPAIFGFVYTARPELLLQNLLPSKHPSAADLRRMDSRDSRQTHVLSWLILNENRD